MKHCNENVHLDRGRRGAGNDCAFLALRSARLVGETFPWGTLVVNVSGSFIIGFFAALTGPGGRVYVGSAGRQFVMFGICGGYTTFSSFSLQTLNLMNDGEWAQAGANMGLSLGLCLIAAWAGFALANAINALKWG